MYGRGGTSGGIGSQGADIDEKVKGGLEDIDDVTKVVIWYKAVVSRAACNEELDELVWRGGVSIYNVSFNGSTVQRWPLSHHRLVQLTSRKTPALEFGHG